MIENFANKYSVDYIKEVLETKGYAFFTNGVYNLNIIGIRNPNLVANSFDDTMVVVYKIGGEWITKVYPITTDAGTYWLKKPNE